jgi:multimeric flavodoxin WrbA
VTKRLIAFNGSPRREGNTALLLEEALRGARSEGAETRLVHLNELHLRSCQGCMACQANGGTCAVKDDTHPLLEEIRSSDGILLGSPVYMWQMSAQLKALVDRLFCFLDVPGGYRQRLNPPKRALLFFAQKQPDPDRFRPVFENLERCLDFLGFAAEGTLVAPDVLTPGEVSSRRDLLQKAFEAGAALAR